MRRVLPLLLAVLLGSGISGSALAASLNFTGSIDAEIKYTPEDKWMGRTGFEISAGMSTTNKYTLKLGYFDEEKNFWQGYSSWTFQPSEITLYAQGALWSGGPSLKGTLGDFRMLGPVYMAGDTKDPANTSDTDNAALRGVLVENLPLGNIQTSAFWGWPRASIPPLSAEPKAPIYGASVKLLNYKGIQLDAYGAVRTGSYSENNVIAPNREVYPVKVTNNIGWSQGGTTYYTGIHFFNVSYGKTAWPSSLQYWDVAYIDDSGRILHYEPTGRDKRTIEGFSTPPTSTTPYKYVIAVWNDASNAEAYNWVRNNIMPYANDPTAVVLLPGQPIKYTQLVGAIEGSFAVAGLSIRGQVGQLVTKDEKAKGPEKASFMIISTGTSLDVLGKDVATKPLSLTLEYRNIAQGFTPWARSTVTDSSQAGYNRVEAQRGQRGLNVVASTTIIPENPVDVKLTLDSYTKDATSYQSAVLELATKWAGYELTSKLGTAGTEFTVAREINLGVQDITKLKPSYSVNLTPQSSTHKLSVTLVMNLGAFRGITANFGYETTQQAGQPNATTTTSASATYKAPNGWELSGGWISPDDKSRRDDTYMRLYYKVNL